MIIAITGSVGSGKTTLAKELLKELNKDFEKEELTVLKQRKYELIHLNELAIEHKIEDVKELQTFDFDIDKLVYELNKMLEDAKNSNKNLILEGHFAHFLNPEYVDYLFVVNRDLEELQKEYNNREYNDQKAKDNLEVESFNLCFYEAIEEGFEEEKQVFCLDNDTNLADLVEKIKKIIAN